MELRGCCSRCPGPPRLVALLSPGPWPPDAGNDLAVMVLLLRLRFRSPSTYLVGRLSLRPVLEHSGSSKWEGLSN